LKKDKINQRKN